MLSLVLAMAMAIASLPMVEATPPSPTPTETCSPLPEVAHCVPFSAGGILFLHVNGNVTVVPMAAVRFMIGGEGGCVNLPGGQPVNSFGWPLIGLPAAGPHELTTTYENRVGGTTTVRTPCASYSSNLACAQAHARMVTDVQTVLPPR